MKPIAICVGHSRQKNGRVEGGAVSVDRTSEWEYNRGLATMIAAHLKAHATPSVIIDHYEGAGYGSAMRWVAAKVKELDAACAIELHFNSSDDRQANGHENLYWHSSNRSKLLAAALEANLNFAVPEIKARGPKPRFPGDRGAEFLRATHCPAVIVEPGFGSNPWDWGVMLSKKDRLARAIAEGVMDWQG